MNQENENQYNYTYSAKHQAEIRAIRDKYIEKEADKMEQLRRLDASAKRKGLIVSLTVGILGCLILGIGLSCVTVWSDRLFLIGIIVGIVGIAGVAAAYSLCVYITKKERQRIAPEILKLSDELLK